VVDVLIVLHFVILRIDVFRMHIDFIILQVATIMEVHMSCDTGLEGNAQRP